MPLNLQSMLAPVPKILFFISKGTDSITSVRLYINNEFHVSLTRGKYYLLNLPYQMRCVSMKVITSAGTEHEEMLTVNYLNTDIYLIHVQSDNNISVDQLAGEVKNRIAEEMNSENTILNPETITTLPCKNTESNDN